MKSHDPENPEFSDPENPVPPKQGEISPSDFDRIKRLHLTGSQRYSDRELVERRNQIRRQIDRILKEADDNDLSEDELFSSLRRDGGEEIPVKANNGSLGGEDLEEGEEVSEGNCCTDRQIAANLVRIKAAYTAAVARLSDWKGCQDLAVTVAQAVQPVLGPCWTGKYVWRINVYPFGRWTPFGEGDTWVHHAYAICPCPCEEFGECDECLVLDPYTITGSSWFQTAEIYPFSEWVEEGNVWRATSLPDHDNGSIYRYTMRYYCRRARQGGAIQTATCRMVRKLLMRELARYTGATGAVLQNLYEEYELVPDCC